MKICFIDTLGLCYDGTTLSKRGLGGSESAVILMSKELAKIGFSVTVYNDCTSDDTKPGVYDGVTYRPLKSVETDAPDYDVMIGSRSVAAFAPAYMKERFKTFSYVPDFTRFQQNIKHKILWMHDTFCDGDDLIEPFLLDGLINEVFVLSDFHLDYVTNCDHGKKRMFEVLKRYMFQTRNGIGAMNPGWIDIKDKDPNLFVYNSSLTKGMVPLVNDIWPKVKAQAPDAKLIVIGGFYRFREGHTPDQQELDWREMVKRNENAGLDITFTGVIPQQEISDILRKASYMIYPCAFPETFGISTLEALAHNVPIITCNFGAEEETAIDSASYKIPFPVEPNGLFPWVNKEDQVNRFVDMTLRAYYDKYLHQQKMYACNAVKDICGWNSVAKQWKQHLFHKLGEFLPVDEYREVQKINHDVRKTFGRRFTNLEELQEPRQRQKEIAILTAVYNAEDYVGKCIRSVAAQEYYDYTMYIVNDASTDNTLNAIKQTINSLPEKIRHKFVVINNEENIGAVANHYKIIDEYLGEEQIIMILDGDDWLVNDPNIFHKYNNLYHDGAEFTYGSCWSLADNIPLIAQPYPPEVKEARSYRDYKFNWNMPYTHLRTFHSRLLRGLDSSDLMVNGEWPKAGGDTALFYHLIEKAVPDKIVCVPDVVYVYNDKNPLNDYKINGDEQTKTANAIMGKGKAVEKFSVIVPTMWRCKDVFSKALQSYIDHDLVDEIIIINNDKKETPNWLGLDHPKIKMLNQLENIYCNPAWNLGAEVAVNNKLCFVNDDIEFDTKLFDKIHSRVIPELGVHGMVTGEEKFGHPLSTDYSIDFTKWYWGDNIHGFGQLFFVHKDNWIPVPEGLDLYYGDDMIFHQHLHRGLDNYLIYNLRFYSPMAQTTSDPDIRGNKIETERPIFDKWMSENQLMSIAQWLRPEPTPEEAVVPVMDQRVKRILIAIPCKNDIEADTFKSIYDQIIPDGYETDFQYFYGYAVDQVRNLIADWTVNGYDYLFAVDHDITFAPDTLAKLLSHDKPVVGGIYRQRLEPQRLEVYDHTFRTLSYEELHGKGLVEIGGLGFGCVLVKREVFADIGYPQFVYHQALRHEHTFSEDLDFCRKARDKGYTIWCDTSIVCGHIGRHTYQISLPANFNQQVDVVEEKLLKIASEKHLPEGLVEYTNNLDIDAPKVIYDIGANALEWTRLAKNKWPEAKVIAFEAMDDFNKLYKHFDFDNYVGVLSDQDGKQVKFYENPFLPWGNSYYMENENESPPGCEFNEGHAKVKTARTLDAIVAERNWPLPDMIKIDVQGAEKDILKGAENCLKNCNDIIIEIQHKEYNKGAPMLDEMFDYLASIGFYLVTNIHKKECDGDYHFKKMDKVPTKAFILHTSNSKSMEYSHTAIMSCERVGIQPILFNGFENETPEELSRIFGFEFGSDMNHGAARATAGHFKMWNIIAELDEPIIVLEHDAIMLQRIMLPIPDGKIVALGYKLHDPFAYDHVMAGEPKEIVDIKRHSGAHAYVITPKTARMLLDELKRVGAPRAIDNYYFMRINNPEDTESEVPLAIMDPTPAIGWLRESTIWEGSCDINYDFLDSFKRNHHPKQEVSR